MKINNLTDARRAYIIGYIVADIFQIKHDVLVNITPEEYTFIKEGLYNRLFKETDSKLLSFIKYMYNEDTSLCTAELLKQVNQNPDLIDNLTDEEISTIKNKVMSTKNIKLELEIKVAVNNLVYLVSKMSNNSDKLIKEVVEYENLDQNTRDGKINCSEKGILLINKELSKELLIGIFSSKDDFEIGQINGQMLSDSSNILIKRTKNEIK